ncbi:hypothetical protein PMKS-003559 [Pichia membranifaciens]|uniref:Uncharacterized protein n=1 Tax=Pichia membranifaciens TaxID=4926 RepID=A0A1Q2YL21_9ASCO|nr:hypothetical protein PMKS-003559 [Pichia membranifaciens]
MEDPIRAFEHDMEALVRSVDEEKDAGKQGTVVQEKKEGGDEDEDDEDDEDDFIPERTNSIENVNKGESTAVMAGLDLLDFDDE